MKQDATGHLPGVDLVFADSCTGRIWGTAGIDDLRAGTFDKALTSVRKSAEEQQAFDWQIEVDLEQVSTTAQRPLAAFLRGLDQIVKAGESGQRSITVNWRVKSRNVSLLSLARVLKKEFDDQEQPKVIINIIVVSNLSKPTNGQ